MNYLKTKTSRAVLIAVTLTASLSHVGAAEDTSAASNALRIGSGPDGKVYQQLVRDMQAVCGKQVSIVNMPSIGGIPNLMKLSASQLDLGIMQIDTLREIGRDGDENIQNLQAVMPLHINLLHILSLRDGFRMGESSKSFVPWDTKDTRDIKVIRNFSDMRGIRVAVVGSTMLLGQRLNVQHGYGMDLRKAETDDDAVKMLKEGKVQAIFTDGGWPLPSVARHKSDSGLSMVEYDLPAQGLFSIVKRNYENLDTFNLKFLGSPNVLVTRPFKPNGEMGKRVAVLQECLIKNLDELQEGRYHAAWKEIKNPLDTLGIARFSRPEGSKPSKR